MTVPETPLEMTERHVREGQERIAHQEALILRLQRQRHTEMLADAWAFLEQMRHLQALAVEHLARLKAQ